MDYVLLNWEGNWADEMDISGFGIMKREDWEDYKKMLENRGEFTFCIGTNEEIEYDNGPALLEEIEVRNITEEEYNIIQKLFGGEYGFTDFLEVEEDYDDEDDDEDE
jgi:hypothetical protein